MDEHTNSIIIYYSFIYKIGGIETWILNMCQHLHKYYKITVLYDSGDIAQLKNISQYATVIKRKKDKQYTADVILFASHLNTYPKNVKAKKKISVVHSDYKYYKDLIHKDIIGDNADEIICVSDTSADSLKNICNKDGIVIPNILGEKVETKKILRLVSFTRLSPEKGYNRMLKLIDMLKEASIKFQWIIFSDIEDLSYAEKIQCEEVIFKKPTLDKYDYITDADYLVQFSDTEAFCYSVHEALQYGTPVLVTDIEVFKDIVIDGYNGYKFNLDMSNVNIHKIYNNIPNQFRYDDKAEDIMHKWFDVLGNPTNTVDNTKTEPDNVRLEVISDYFDIELNKDMKLGDKFTTTDLRAYELCGYDNAAKIPLCRIIN